MALSTITVGTQTITVVDLPSSPNLASIEWNASDTVAAVPSVFTQQVQTQKWTGADLLRGTATLPYMQQCDADEWIAFLMACRGMKNAFLLGDPMKQLPRADLQGSVPTVHNAGSGVNQPGSETLTTAGWAAGSSLLLLPGDYLQLGYRLYRNLTPVSADGSGNAVLNIWPSLREQPADGSALILSGAKGLFRRASNQVTWSVAANRRLTALSFQIQEYR